jgi:hypothetical protein
MKRAMKIAGILLLIIILTVGILLASNWKDIKNFQPMASGAYAKFMCSCLFVEGRTEEQCKIWSRLSIPQSGYTINKKDMTVTSTALWYTSTARYKDKKLGCTLE